MNAVRIIVLCSFVVGCDIYLYCVLVIQTEFFQHRVNYTLGLRVSGCGPCAGHHIQRIGVVDPHTRQAIGGRIPQCMNVVMLNFFALDLETLLRDPRVWH